MGYAKKVFRSKWNGWNARGRRIVGLWMVWMVCVCVRDIGSVLVSMVSDVRGFRSRKMEYHNFRFTAIFKPFFERSTWVCFVMAVVSLFVNSFVGIYRVLGYREYLFF